MNPLLVSNTTEAVNLKQVFASGVVPCSIQNPYVYAIGTVVPDFPSLCIEKEFLQCLPADAAQALKATTSSSKPLSMSDLKPYFYTVLSQTSNFHLAREMLWQFSNIDNNTLFTIKPSSNDKLKALVNATQLSSDNKQYPMQALVGRKAAGSLVKLTNLLSVGEQQIIKQVLKTNGSLDASKLTDIVEFILSLQANDGQSAKSRAINYALNFNPEIYLKTYELLYGSNANGANPSGYQLLGISSREQHYNQGQQVDLIFNYAGINSGAKQSWYCSVDVSGEFPYLLKTFNRFLPST